MTLPLKQKSEEIKIGVCIHNGYEPFVWEIANNMTEWCRAKERETGIKISIEVLSSKGSQLTQNEQVEKFIAKGVDVLCVNLVDRTDPTVIIDSAMESDTPVIFFNRELVKEDLDMWDKLYYVGAIAQQSGRLQAEIIIDALSDERKFNAIDVNHNKSIQYVMLEGEPGHQDALVRTSVCTDMLKDAGISIEKECMTGIHYPNKKNGTSKTNTIYCRGYFRGKNIAYNETINLKRRTTL